MSRGRRLQSPFATYSPHSPLAQCGRRLSTNLGQPGSGSGASKLQRSGSLSKGAYRAPSGFSDSDSGSEHEHTASFSLQAPSGYSDSEAGSAEEDEVQSKLTMPGRSPSLPRHSPAHAAISELTALLRQQQLAATQGHVSRFEAGLLEIEAAHLRELASIKAQRQADAERQASAEAERKQQREGQRSELLSALKQVHSQKAQEGSRQVEAAARQALEQRQREQQQRQREEAARKAKEDAEKLEWAEQAAKRQQEQQARQAQQAAEATKAPQQAAAQQPAPQQRQQRPAGPSGRPDAQNGAAAPAQGQMRIAASAAALEKRCAERLQAAEAEVAEFKSHEGVKKDRRSLEKFITLNVQQISGTQEQVAKKSAAFVDWLGRLSGVPKTYAYLQLAARIISQCECQVSLNHQFAFPLAEVIVAVAAAHQDFTEILLGKLHQACILTVPKYYLYKAADEANYYRVLGYRSKEKGHTGEMARETMDDYVIRMQGYLLFLAAVMQSDRPGNPIGVDAAWQYIARLLNALPANRIVATALDAFLKVAGYKLNMVYGRQFVKLLHYVDQHFLPDLQKGNDPDAKAVHTRIYTYLTTTRFMTPPEGRNLPLSDSSSYDRA